MKHFVGILILVFSLNVLNSQNFDFGKVSKDELQEKFHPKDSAAAAAILYRNESISFYFTSNEGFMQRRDVHERVKIYNKEGFDWATKKVYLYKEAEKISGLKGYTYNLVNGELEKNKLKKEGIFDEDYNQFLRINSFTLPNAKEGSVLEYKYAIISKRISIDDVIFQFSVPMNKLDVKIATPEYYIYNKQFNFQASYLPKVAETYIYTRTPFEYKINVCTLNETDIPALRAEAYSGNINNYRSKMAMELTAILNGDKVIEKTFSSSWEEVSKTIYDSDDFGGQLGKFNFYKDDLEALLEGVEDDFEKAQLVEDFVKSKVKWNGVYGKYAQNGIRSAYKEGEGNDADINLLVISMLRSQGVNANPVVLSTRNNGIPLFPTREGLNYVICSVEKDDTYMFIDATEQYSANNILPERVLNWRARLIKNDKISRWLDLKPTKKSVESSISNVVINDDLTVTGKVGNNFTDYMAYFYREKYGNMSLEDHIKSLEKDKGGIEISELEVKNIKDVNESVKVSYEYELSDGIDEVGDKLYFSPLLFFAIKENPFKLEERQYPIDFVIPFVEKYMVNIRLPEGYDVEFIPQSSGLEFKDGSIKFSYLIQQRGNMLQLSIKTDVVNPIVIPSDYKGFKEFYGKIIEKQAEQIVLTKA